MPIRFYCEACTARIKVPDATEGKLVKCPGCGQAQRVPQESADEPPAAVAAEPAKARKSTSTPVVPSRAVEAEGTLGDEPGEGDASASDDHGEKEAEHSDSESHADSLASHPAEGGGQSQEDDSPLDALAAMGNGAADDASTTNDSATDFETEEIANAQPVDDVSDPVGVDGLPTDQDDRVDIDQQSAGKAQEPIEAWPADEQVGYEIDAAEAEPVEAVAAESVSDAYDEERFRAPVARRRTDRRHGERRDTDRRSGHPPKLTGLLVVGWMLRILAIAGVPGVVKIVLWMGDSNAGAMEIVFITPLLLGLVVMFWAVGELALTVRTNRRQNN